MKRRPIFEAWQSYRRDVIPPTAGMVQLHESRLAFYAGAGALFSGIIGGLSEGEEDKPEDLELLDAIQGELREHLEAVRKAAAER